MLKEGHATIQGRFAHSNVGHFICGVCARNSLSSQKLVFQRCLQGFTKWLANYRRNAFNCEELFQL